MEQWVGLRCGECTNLKYYDVPGVFPELHCKIAPL